MADPRHSWIYLSISAGGMHWPPRSANANSVTYTRLSGRWLSETEFETDGGVFLVPAPDTDGDRRGPVTWRPGPT